MTRDGAIDKIIVALSMFASTIKSGEAWDDVCETALREAKKALAELREKK